MGSKSGPSDTSNTSKISTPSTNAPKVTLNTPNYVKFVNGGVAGYRHLINKKFCLFKDF